MEVVFRPEHVGQKVTSTIFGRGFIIEVDDERTLPIAVRFVALKGGESVIVRFTEDGRQNRDDFTPTLKFGWGGILEWDYGEQEIVYKPLNLAEGETAWCYVGDDERTVLRCSYKKMVIATDHAEYMCMPEGKANNQTLNIFRHEYAMRCSGLD